MTAHQIWPGSTCFTTHVVTNHLSIFTSVVYFEAICKSLNYCSAELDLKIHGYVIMPDHLHLLTNIPDEQPVKLQDILARFRRFTGTKISEMLRLDGKQWALDKLATTGKGIALWETHYYPVDASRIDILSQKLGYIHLNPVRAGFVREASDWQFSSAKDYRFGTEGPVRIVPAGDKAL